MQKCIIENNDDDDDDNAENYEGNSNITFS